MSIGRYELMNQERRFQQTKKRVAAYCRVSTDNEDQANSFESQLRFFRQYIQCHQDWELFEVFADEGLSGTTTKKRKAFNRMIVCAKNGELDLIVTKEISRFARNTLDSISYTRELKEVGVGVIFMNDNINTLDGDAELRLAIMSSIAQEESRRTSERVKWGQKRQMEQGVVFGRSMLGYDVASGKMTINSDGADVVRLIFQKFVREGKGTHVIARELREAGIYPMRVKEWSNTVILRLLRNEKYCGDLVQKKTYTPDYLSHNKKCNRGQEEFVILKDHHEPIISRELFNEANRILDERSDSMKGKSKHSNRYPFSGKIKCGCCGSSYVARYKTRKDGSRYKGWRCYEASKNGQPRIDVAGNQVGCTGPGIRNEDAIHIMCLVMRQLRLDKGKVTDDLLKAIRLVIQQDMSGFGTEAARRLIESCEVKKEKLLDLYLSGELSREKYLAEREKQDAAIEAQQALLASVSQQEELFRREEELMVSVKAAVNDILSGVEAEDEVYTQLLEKMVIEDGGHISVYLHLLPFRWAYTMKKLTPGVEKPERNSSDASVPISVSSPFSSSKGME